MKTKNIFYPIALFAFLIIGSSFSNSENINNRVEPKIENESFAKYLSHFEKVSLPFEMGLDETDVMIHYGVGIKDLKRLGVSKKEAKKIGFKIEEDQKVDEVWGYHPTVLFSRRSGPPIIIPIARFYVDEDKIATVIRKQQDNFARGFHEYKLVMYDLKGNVLTEPKTRSGINIDSQSITIVSGSPQKAESFYIDKNGIIKTDSYKKVWEKDVSKSGYKGNSVKEYDYTHSLAYEINKDGSIVEINPYLINTRACID
jgi:hypothetical protein